jgi:sec-independent protein translocase protein TatC
MERELKELRQIFFMCVILFMALALIIFPFSLMIFENLYSFLVPANIKMLIINPLNLFLVQIQISAFLAFLASLPFLVYKMSRFVFPALYSMEKRIIKGSASPSIFLFCLGALFALFFLIPMTLKLLNFYALSLPSAETYFEINQFITFTLVAIIACGFSFMLPIFMRTLSALGLVTNEFWKKNFKYSLIAIVILSAIITPDGTGITMLMLSIPLTSLYLAGIVLSKGVTVDGNY